ncbi:MAG: membrane protease YdiL (CAAX protease family) [Lentimonas sp.]|jgi:membrane protease YdiL (CAAX protease family)
MDCTKCLSLLKENAKFCGKCGAKISEAKKKVDHSVITRLIVFFVSLLLYIAILNWVEAKRDYILDLITDSLFSILILVFFALDFKNQRKLFSFRRVKIKALLPIIIVAPLFALSVLYFSDYVNRELFDTYSLTYYYQYMDSPAPWFFAILSIAVFPAVFEEIAFRGVIFDLLRKVTPLKSVILISSILFFLLHLSLISILWILPIGIVFAIYRAKYNTLWYGIIGHFIYNASCVILQELVL